MRSHRMNPLDILISMESVSCKGCEREMFVMFGTDKVMGCTKGKPHGIRCKHYKQKGKK